MGKLKVNKFKLKRLIASLGIGGALVFTGTSFGPYVDLKNSDVGFYYLNTKNIHLSNEDLLDEFISKVNSSEELSDEWKIILPELKDFLIRYGDLIDQEELLDTLSTLKINYVDDLSETGRVLGRYDFNKNSISFDNKINYKSSSEAKEVKLHETFHYLFHQNFSHGNLNFTNIGIELDEGIASMLVREYGDYSRIDINEKSVCYVRSLCELIGAREFMECVGNHNLLQLIFKLSKYTSLPNAINLVMKIDDACKYYDTTGTDSDKAAWAIIEEMYQNKNGIKLENSSDTIMKVYSNYLADTWYNSDGQHYSSLNFSKKYFVTR